MNVRKDQVKKKRQRIRSRGGPSMVLHAGRNGTRRVRGGVKTTWPGKE